MKRPSPRKRTTPRVVWVLAICMVALFAPLPSFDFVETAFGVELPLPEMRAAGAAPGSPVDLDAGTLTGGEDDVEEFSMIGLKFDAPPEEPAWVRVLGEDGWSEWNEVEIDADGGPDQGTAEYAAAAEVVSEPLWVDSATGYELRMGVSDVSKASVAVVREEERRVVVEATPASEASPTLPVHRRAAWGARAPGDLGTAASVQFAVVHHTAGNSGHSAAAVPGILRGIQAFHMDVNQWSDIGYNFLVDRFGRIWEGRAGSMDKAVIGAHAGGFNTSSVGISVIGNYSGANASAASLEAVAMVVGWKLGGSQVNPLGQVVATSRGSTRYAEGTVIQIPRVVGHRDVSATSCPGAIYGSLRSIQARAGHWANVYEGVHNPVGRLDSATVEGSSITVKGWTKDPNSDASLAVHIAIGDRWTAVTANRSRPDVGAAYPGYGSNRGYETTMSGLAPGGYRVCAYGINVGRGTGNTTLGCTQVVVK